MSWRSVALITSTLFLNFSFWELNGSALPMRLPLPVYTCVVAAGAMLITALFFAGPALATQAAKRPLTGVVENSIGLIPTVGFRICSALFLVFWMGSLMQIPGLWLLRFILRREASYTESVLLVVGILLFLFISGLQGLWVQSKLALFSVRLAIAILIAALLRAHEGWPTITRGLPPSEQQPVGVELWRGLSLAAVYVAPLSILAANYGRLLETRAGVLKTTMTGIALPLFGTLILVAIIEVATGHSSLYQPSLNPSIAMALWSHASARYQPGTMTVATITVFGAARFGANALTESLSFVTLGQRAKWAATGMFIAVIAWLSLHADFQTLFVFRDLAARALIVVGAVVTADVVAGKRWGEGARRVDWVGVGALLAGLGTPLYLPDWVAGAVAGEWWQPWLFPSYCAAFLVCGLGRVLQKQSRTSLDTNARPL
jgi:hypothetical protein